MGNTSYAFVISLFNVFLTWIVFANFLGWSGGYVAVLGESSSYWENSYFGFQSIWTAIDDFDITLKAWSNTFGIDFTFSGFNKVVYRWIDVCGLGIPEFVNRFNTGNVNLLDIVTLILKVLFQPVLFLGYTLFILAYFVLYIFVFFQVFMALIGGRYNVPLDNTEGLWNQWSYLVSEWDWSSLSWDWSSLQAHVQ